MTTTGSYVVRGATALGENEMPSSTNDADTLTRYKRLAARLTLPDGSKPLMAPCPLDYGLYSNHRCPICNPTGGLIPFFDLRQGQEVVPVGALVGSLQAAGFLVETSAFVSHKQSERGQFEVEVSRMVNEPPWHHVYGARDYKDTLEAALVDAATAALDAREGART